MDKEFYQAVPGTSYDDLLKSRNPFRRWFHVSRYRNIQNLVDTCPKPHGRILDLGSASCCWNTKKLPVVGLDFNEALLKQGKQCGRLVDYRVADAAHTGFEDKSFDVVVGAEVLEHMKSPDLILREVHRVLKDDGRFVISVPDDGSWTAWKALFSLVTFYYGYLLGDPYMKSQCGHIHHFSAKDLKKILVHNGFEIEKYFTFWTLTLYCVVRKSPNS
ncbi:MAG: methyltransferase domain-containing protein [Candidatus Omnitrophica bacterium]|nr:methyltransferase domain-containing protein [Candidatus Omnitrophota bacterium]